MKNVLLLIVLCLCIATLMADPIWDNATNVRKSINPVWNGSSAVTSNGSTIYVWSDISNGSRDIFAARVAANGDLLWNAAIPITLQDGEQDYPIIIPNQDDEFIVAYVDYRTNPSGTIRARKINAEGTLFWDTNGAIVNDSSERKHSLHACTLANNDVLFTWNIGSYSSSDIYAQKLNSSGIPVWNALGMQLSYSPGGENQHDVFPLADDGFIITYSYAHATGVDAMMMRYNSSGNWMWASPVEVCPTADNAEYLDAVRLPQNKIAVLFRYNVTIPARIAVQILNIEGDLVTDTPLLLSSESSNLAYEHAITAGSDNSLFVSWNVQSTTNASYYCSYLQKISAEGNLLWNPEGIVYYEGYQSYRNPLLVADSNGGVHIAWSYMPIDNYIQDSKIAAKHYDQNSQLLWTIDEVVISNNRQSLQSASSYAGNLQLSWNGFFDEKEAIRTQKISYAGSLQWGAEGRIVFSGLAGNVSQSGFTVLNLPQGAMLLWTDYRDESNPRIFYQIVDFEGAIVLPENGVSLGTCPDGTYFDTLVTPDGKVAIVWRDYLGSNPIIRCQLLSANGSKLWGEEGIILSSPGSLTVSDAHVSYDDGAYYFGWTGGDNDTVYIYAQKIVDATPQWTEGGITLKSVSLSDGYHSLQELEGRYYAVSSDIWQSSEFTISIILINPDGSPVWQDVEKPVCAYDTFMDIQLLPQLSLDVDGLYVSWQDLRNDFISKVYAQKISPSGEYLWNPEGVEIGLSYDISPFAQMVGSDGITHIWVNNSWISGAKHSSSGEMLWQNETIQEPSWSISNRRASLFENGKVLYTFMDYSDQYDNLLFYRYLDSNGVPMGLETGYTLTTNGRTTDFQDIDGAGNTAYIAWNEGKFRPYEERPDDAVNDPYGLYIQKFHQNPLSNPETELPAMQISLHQNYPNPFNPNTTIVFDLMESTPVSLEIYNMRGQLVKTLIDGKKNAGTHTAVWDGKDEGGLSVSSGVYLYKVKGGKFSSSKKMILMK